MEGLDNECTTKNPTTKAEGIDLSVLNEQKRRRGKIKRGLEGRKKKGEKMKKGRENEKERWRDETSRSRTRDGRRDHYPAQSLFK